MSYLSSLFAEIAAIPKNITSSIRIVASIPAKNGLIYIVSLLCFFLSVEFLRAALTTIFFVTVETNISYFVSFLYVLDVSSFLFAALFKC